ncbi:hypothetical protein V8F33_000702 [Rhypophila sp. PSN 637]
MSTLEEITSTIPPKQKARLEEVASLMLEIYQTLVRMRYFGSEDWVQVGPHDVSALLPLYQSLNLDPAVIYLYSILPYIDLEKLKTLWDPTFYNGSTFADFRNAEHVKDGRDPFQTDDDPWNKFRGWLTPLSLVGHLYSYALVYDARRNLIRMYSMTDLGNGDPNEHEGAFTWTTDEDGNETGWAQYGKDGLLIPFSTKEEYLKAREVQERIWEEKARLQEGDDESGDDEDGDNEEEEEEEEEVEDEDDGEDGEEKEDKEEPSHWDEMDGRWAPDVLRDVIRWFHELKEIPGLTNSEAGHEQEVRELYVKYGWPGPGFDGDGFLEDMEKLKQ